ncbi:hypothetical protein [Mycoplasma sp. P36-A1]|uniref:hypothetical protein n=1 Tax=Mycoplasma sp. P36-A1 TaxID=3252900 RepID=UPI003C2D38AD
MIKLLSKIFYNEMQSIKFIRKGPKYRFLMNLIAVIAIIAVFVAILSPLLFNADTIAKYIPINIGYFTLGLGLMALTLISLISSFGFTYSLCYLDKNLENYLFMPIKSRDFVIAKVITIYKSVLMIVGLAYIPLIIIAIRFSGFDLMMIVSSLLFLITIPLITTYISLILAGTILYFLNKLKNKTIARNFLYFLFIVALLGLNMSISFFMSSFGDDTSELAKALTSMMSTTSKIMFYPTWAMEVFTVNKYINLLYMLIAVVVGAISILYFEKIYYKGAIGFSKDYYRSKGKKFKVSEVKTRSVKKWFFFMEAKQLIKTSAYFFNTIFGNLIVVVVYLGMMGYFYFTMDEESVEVFASINDYISIPAVFLVGVCITSFFALFNNGAATAYSREAYNLEALKSMPIDMKSAFIGKVIFHFILEFATSFIFMVIPMLVIGLNIQYVLIMIVSVFLVTCAFSFIPLCADLKFPSLEWESDIMVVKRSKSIWITMLSSLLFAGIVIGATISGVFLLNLDINIVAGVISVLLIVLAIGFYLLYRKLIDKAFS